MPAGKSYGGNVNYVSNPKLRAKQPRTPKRTGGGSVSLVKIDSSLRRKYKPPKGV